MKRKGDNDHAPGKKKAKGGWVSISSNNARMHPRNPFNGKEPDFSALAAKYDFFANHVKVNPKTQRPYIKYKDPKAVICLNRALMKDTFGLEWNVPIDRLCPPISNRLNYILWIQDLLKLNAPLSGNASAVGFDIGTGASCIYPLLGTAVEKNWRFIATDIDDKSLESARKNVVGNNLETRIDLRKVNRSVRIAGALRDSDGPLAFCMCNPPFFASALDIKQNQDAACMGSRDELVCEGGEEAFVSGIVDDSVALKGRVRWYTTMLGKKSSVKTILRLLRSKGIKNIVTTDFLQGRTTRWGIGWCFEQARPQDHAIRATVNRQVAMGNQKAKKKTIDGVGANVFPVPFVMAKSVLPDRLHDLVEAFKKKHGNDRVATEEDGDGKVSIQLQVDMKEQGTVELELQVSWKQSQNSQTGAMEDTVSVCLTRAEPLNLGKAEFFKASQQVQADLQRTNRKWRRMMAKQGMNK
uniref:U6 small nuclear RNA (adenine-(43)-N(6))-methyltransferase n=1 Tax=Lotharella oceanica TaxID=641309 RepID=A0A7S2TVK9_9EUKA|mmetsp:Transcript_29612/g.55401  ORF Transcript_29612/g.55401 Transcript_29612/m.55401 type:complete len:468 (+) Transcript_29612:80-1483(+)